MMKECDRHNSTPRAVLGTRQSGDACVDSNRNLGVSTSVCYRMAPDKSMLDGAANCVDQTVCASRFSAVDNDSNRMPPCLLSEQQHSLVDIGGVHRIALMITPQNQGAAIDQAWEAISTIRVILGQQSVPMKMVQQTVFVRSAEDIPAFRGLFEAYFGDSTPASNYIVQPPCGGQALAIEAWAIGGDQVEISYLERDVVSVDYASMKWVYLAGISPSVNAASAYEQSESCLAQLDQRLNRVGATLSDVPRVWLYQGGITEEESGIERYRELNRARTDYFDSLSARGAMRMSQQGIVYPASTGIGTNGSSLVLSAMVLQTHRDDVRWVALENPGQTSAFDYEKKFSIKSPKFSRAMAVITDEYATIWISGTASILDSETVHIGDIEKQTHQTIDNMERLIAEENLAAHGFKGCGATLQDLAKVRVYIKHVEDYEKCRAICEARFGSLPTIYANADVCRPDLLVEIEGVAFTTV